MPMTGGVQIDRDRFRSHYSREQAHPGEYSVYLDDYGVAASMTATERTGLSRYHFPAGSGSVVLDLSESSGHLRHGYVHMISLIELEGWKEDGEFCGQKNRSQIFFVARFSKPAKVHDVFDEGNIVQVNGPATEISGDSVGAIYQFEFLKADDLYLSVGISYVSIEKARLNLDQEQRNVTYESVRDSARARWNDTLSRVQLKDGTSQDHTLFYTSLYRALLLPSIVENVNGEYVGFGHNKTRRYTDGRHRVCKTVRDCASSDPARMAGRASLLHRSGTLPLHPSPAQAAILRGWRIARSRERAMFLAPGRSQVLAGHSASSGSQPGKAIRRAWREKGKRAGPSGAFFAFDGRGWLCWFSPMEGR